MELAAFLIERISEDEAVAREVQARASVYGDREVSWKWLRVTGGSSMWEPTNHTPARILAECEAKRRIVAYADTMTQLDRDRARTRSSDAWVFLAAIALPYAEHPDYDPAWRP